jgi:hypothetical protein
MSLEEVAIQTTSMSLQVKSLSFLLCASWQCSIGTSLWSAAGGAIDTVNLVSCALYPLNNAVRRCGVSRCAA